MDLAAARTALLQHLDDDGSRWPEADQDRALAHALSACLTDYAAAGGDRLDTIEQISTTSAGVGSLSAQNPIRIKSVSLKEGTQFFPIAELPMSQRMYDDTTVRTIEVRYIRGYTLPTTSTHALVGVTTTAANTWQAFEDWIVARAALFASVKDEDMRDSLARLESQMRDSILVMPTIPSQVPFPRATQWRAAYLGWSYRPDTKAVILTRRGPFL